jgi:hypothetical protein
VIVDLEDREEKGTFELKGGGKVHLRLLSAEDLREMRAACVKNVPEYPLLKDPETGKERYFRFEREEFDGEKFRKMQLDRNITGWDGITENGKPVEATLENKSRLYSSVPDFREAVDNGIEALKAAEKARLEASEKNSLKQSDGKTNTSVRAPAA